MTEQDVSHMLVDVPCAQCGQQSKQRLGELEVNDIVTCTYCRSSIDVSSQSWRAKISKLVEEYKKFKSPRALR